MIQWIAVFRPRLQSRSLLASVLRVVPCRYAVSIWGQQRHSTLCFRTSPAFIQLQFSVFSLRSTVYGHGKLKFSATVFQQNFRNLHEFIHLDVSYKPIRPQQSCSFPPCPTILSSGSDYTSRGFLHRCRLKTWDRVPLLGSPVPRLMFLDPQIYRVGSLTIRYPIHLPRIRVRDAFSCTYRENHLRADMGLFLSRIVRFRPWSSPSPCLDPCILTTFPGGNPSVITMPHSSLYIPPELYRPIVLCDLHQDRPSLLAVSLASLILNAEGQRVLFRMMDISRDAQTTHTLFLTTILSQERLASLVEEYRQPNNILRSREDPLWDLLRRGLQAMVNLKRLSLEAPSNGRPSVEILCGCTFQLDLLQWYNANKLNEEEPEFLEFLASQPRLRSLSVRMRNASTPIPRATRSKFYMAIKAL